MEKLLKFVELTQDFKAVRRKVILAKEEREENDAEHSFQLALVGWYIITKEKLPLNIELSMKYALSHDLVEVYAGDTPAGLHKGYDEQLKTKHEREAKAAKQLKEKFPEFPELHKLIEDYEGRIDEESKFINALDKILPVINIYLDEGHSWKAHNISFDDLIENKTDKIAISPIIKKYFDEIVTILTENKEKLFN